MSVEAPAETTRTLVIPPVGLEGLVASLPLCAALTGSGRRLTLALTEDLVPLGNLSAAAQCFVRPSGGGPAPLLHPEDFDEAVVLDESLGAALWVRGAKISSWGYGGGLRRFILRRAVPRPRRAAGCLRPEYYQDLQRAMGMPIEDGGVPLELPEELRTRARERLERAHLRLSDGPLLGIYAGREGSPRKPWPRKSFEELLRRLRRQEPRLQVILFATTDDLWTAVRIYEETGKIHPVLGPDLSVDVLAAVLGELDLLIAGESRFLHLAAAVDTSTLGLFIRDPDLWGPQGEKHRAVQRLPLKALGVEELEERVVF